MTTDAPRTRVKFDNEGKNPFDLTGRHALVTGATGALARAMAVALAEAGADVSTTTLRDDASEEAQANSILNEAWSLGRKGQAARVDLTDPVSVEAAVAAIERDIAPIDILVNATHEANIKSVLDSSVEEWRSEIERTLTPIAIRDPIGR